MKYYLPTVRDIFSVKRPGSSKDEAVRLAYDCGFKLLEWNGRIEVVVDATTSLDTGLQINDFQFDDRP